MTVQIYNTKIPLVKRAQQIKKLKTELNPLKILLPLEIAEQTFLKKSVKKYPEGIHPPKKILTLHCYLYILFVQFCLTNGI